jgi:amino acid adenylation domain-containing protein
MVTENEVQEMEGAGLYDPAQHDELIATAEAARIAAIETGEAERRQLTAWATTQQDYPHGKCVPQLVAEQAAAAPEAVALVADEQTITYQQLSRRSSQLAHHLQALGVGPEVVVGVCLERSVEMVIGLLAVLKAGGAYLPLDPAYPAKRLAFMLEDARAPVLVTCRRLMERIPTGAAQVICLDADAEALAQYDTSDPAPTATAANLAYVIYTSGSTGQPKGVQITHDSLLNLIFWHQRAFAVTATDRATQLAGPAFDATTWELWPYLTAGASLFLPDEETRVTPPLLRDWLLAHQITISFVPTALAESLMVLEWPPTTPLRFLLTGADTLHRYPSQDVPFTLVNNYGPTENTVVTTSGRVLPTDSPASPPPIGRPIANTDVYLLDEHLRPVPLGAPGELYIAGAGLSRGYLNQPALTSERFIPNPFRSEPGARLYRTGDLARYLPDGQIAFLGRVDSQIKIRGYRIEPDEIVAVLNSLPGIQASAVAAREDAVGEKSLVAYVVPRPGVEVTLSAIRDPLQAHVPDYMIPAAFVLLEALPLTPNGKIDRAALPAPDTANTLRDVDDAVPLSPIEEQVAAIVASLLKLDHVGPDDNFFLLGGHSMLGTQLIARLADTFNVEFSLRALFDSPTVRELSAEIERQIYARLETMSDEEVQQLLA